jgi:hypothetical protein
VTATGAAAVSCAHTSAGGVAAKKDFKNNYDVTVAAPLNVITLNQVYLIRITK